MPIPRTARRLGSQDISPLGFGSKVDLKENISGEPVPLTERKSPLMNPSFSVSNILGSQAVKNNNTIPPKPNLLLLSSNNYFEKKGKI